MSDFIIEENKYNILTWKYDNILTKYEGSDEIVYVPDGVNIVKGAFQNNSTVRRIILPDSVTAIDCHAFQDCTNLEEIVFSDNIEIIRPYAFNGCVALKELHLPKALKKLEASFRGLNSLEVIEFPKAITEIDLGGCPSLKRIIASNKAKSLVLYECDSIEEIILPESVEALTAYNCKSLKSVRYSKKLRACSFQNCNSIKELILPEGVSQIGVENCGSLEHIYIPRSVTYLGSGIFKGVKSGLNITYGGSLENWQKLISDRETYDGNGPTLNQYHYLGELAWIAYGPDIKTERVIDTEFKYNLKCEI